MLANATKADPAAVAGLADELYEKGHSMGNVLPLERNYLFMAMGFHYAGTLVNVTPDYYVLKDAWMVSVTGACATYLGSAKFDFAEYIGTNGDTHIERQAVESIQMLPVGKKISAARSTA